MAKRLFVIFTLIVIFVLAGTYGYLYWRHTANTKTEASVALKTAQPPVLTKVYWVDPPEFNKEYKDYRTTLQVKFQPTTAPLHLDVAIHWKNIKGEGDQKQTYDISSAAADGQCTTVIWKSIP